MYSYCYYKCMNNTNLYTNLERELNKHHNRNVIRTHFLRSLDHGYVHGLLSDSERNKLEMKAFMNQEWLYQWFIQNRRQIGNKGLFVYLPDSQLLEALQYGNSWEEIEEMDEEVYSHLEVDCN